MQALFLACIRAYGADYWRIVFKVKGTNLYPKP